MTTLMPRELLQANCDRVLACDGDTLRYALKTVTRIHAARAAHLTDKAASLPEGEAEWRDIVIRHRNEILAEVQEYTRLSHDLRITIQNVSQFEAIVIWAHSRECHQTEKSADRYHAARGIKARDYLYRVTHDREMRRRDLSHLQAWLTALREYAAPYNQAPTDAR